MGVKYDKLWAIVEARGMTWEDLRQKAGLTVNAVTRLRYNENTQVETLAKVCCALDCTINDILEIEYQPSALIPIEEIDICELRSWSQYSDIGLSSLDDFPPPHTARSIRDTLIDNFISSKLRLDACEELVGLLHNKGIEIDFPKDIVPDIKYIPKTFAEFEDEPEETQDLINKQIQNYFDWALLRYGEILDYILVERNCEPNHSLLEYGQLNVCKNGDIQTVKFIGQNVEVKNTQDCYPLNLLSAVCGSSSVYVFAETLPNITAAFEYLTQRLLPSEQLWIKLKYQHGLSATQILRVLDLPDYETLLDIADQHSKALRKLRHPLSSKLVRDFVKQLDPYAYSRFTTMQYDKFVDEIKECVEDALLQGQTLERALSPYYEVDTIEQVTLNANAWKTLPDVSIDDLELSWKAYTALSNAKIHTLSELWDAHGKTTSISDTENSGLAKIPGLGQSQIHELLERISEYKLEQIDSSKASNIVDFAESLISNSDKSSSIDCAIMPCRILDCFLRMKYRTIDKLLLDYKSGVLIHRVGTEFPAVVEQAISVMEMLSSNQYTVVHFTNNKFWKDLLAKSPEYTFETVRMAYLNDLVIKCNPQALQEHIHSLFPIKSTEYELMYKTRSQEVKWLPWPLPLFTESVKKKLRLSGNNTEISSAFFAADEQATTCWLAVKVVENQRDKFVFFTLDKGELCNFAVEDAGESIFQAIEFSSEILLNTPLWEAHINANFILAQRSFCKFYCSYAKTEEEKKFLDTYFPRELKSKASDQSRHNITIEELDLSVRSFNVLKRANINTLGDLMRVERNQFLRFRGFGNKSAVEIVRKALMCGVKLTDSVMALYEECKSTATKPISDDI